MMNKKDHIDTEIRKTMEVLENLPDLKTSYLLRARLMERISHETSQSFHEVNSAARGLKLALMALLLIINIGSALVLMLSNGNEQMLTKNDILESLTNEYSNPALSYYLDNDSIEETNE